MKHQPTYLYQVKNSKNFYFRIRKNVFSEKFGYHHIKSEHFVASLKTSEYDEALWLSQFILKRIKDDLNMNNSTLQADQLLSSQVKHLHDINSLFHFDETEFKLRFNVFLKDRFSHWLNVGTKMLKLGVTEGNSLMSLRTIKPEVLRQHYAKGNEAESHPSPDKLLVDVFNKESSRLGYSTDARLLEAEMINRLIAELSKAGKKYKQFSPELMIDNTEFDASKDFEFLNLIGKLEEFRNFARKAERKAKIERERHLTLRICIAEFRKSKFAEVGISGQQQYDTSLNLLQSIFGDEFLVTEFTGQEVIKFKNALLETKSGRKLKGIEQTLGKKSINKYMSNVRQLFQWLIEVPKYLTLNPFSGVSMKIKSRQQNRRRQFSADEIQQLIEYRPLGIKEARTIRNAAKWFVPIALYSGMRLNEIASLMIRDIKQEEGIYFFDLSQYTGKTDNAPRIIPIHSKLINSEFLKYVKEQKELGKKRLFSELDLTSATAKRDGSGTQVGNWFNDTMLAKIDIHKKTELDTGIMVDFHCARHTVASRFKYHGVDGYIAKQILGHHQEDEITWGVYAAREGTKLSVLKRVIESLDY
jgi:integrase